MDQFAAAFDTAFRISSWSASRRARLAEIDTASIRALREGHSGRLQQLDDAASAVRALSWDGDGEPPAIPTLPAFDPAAWSGRFRIYRVRVKNNDHDLTNEDALQLFAAAVVAGPVDFTFSDGSTELIDVGDLEEIGRQIMEQRGKP